MSNLSSVKDNTRSNKGWLLIFLPFYLLFSTENYMINMVSTFIDSPRKWLPKCMAQHNEVFSVPNKFLNNFIKDGWVLGAGG